jgi:flavin-dependent dehydrogenase
VSPARVRGGHGGACDDAEVIVVGGGPAGAATAAALADRGRRVLLLERSPDPTEKPCGEYYGPGVVDALDRLGVLGAATASGHARPLGMRVRVEGDRRRGGFLLHYPGEGGGGFRRALGVRRGILDAALLERARAAGVEVVAGARVSGVVRTSPDGRVCGVRARLPGDAAEDLLGARLVVGADGRRSRVARALGLEAHARWPDRLGLAAHYRLPEEGGPGGEVAAMHVGGPGLYCGIAPVGGGLASVGLVVPMRGPARRARGGVDLAALLAARLPGALDDLEGAVRVSPVRGVGPMARRTRRQAGAGFLLVGDAAGFLDPLTGEGVFRALRGAELAAEAAERALARPDGFPEGYEQARRAAFGGKERLVRLVHRALLCPDLFSRALERLDARPEASRPLKMALGDYRGASAAAPGLLRALLGP